MQDVEEERKDNQLARDKASVLLARETRDL
jgi:hypothetical protein